MNKKIFIKSLFVVVFGFFQFNSFATIDWVGNMFPSSGSLSTIAQGDNFTIYVQVYKAGTTEPAGQGSGINCEIYYGDVNAYGMPWLNIFTQTMAYNIDIGNNDEYVGTVSPLAGLYEFTCRCSDDGGASWTYAALPGGNGMLTVDAPLPVELESFEATSRSNSVGLDWVTSNESNMSYYIIEKSQDSRIWEEVSSVESQGNSSRRVAYTVEDEKPNPGINYYRLKQVDYDGTSAYSEIVSVYFYQNSKIIAYPNPATDFLNISLKEEMTGIFEIYNLQGQLIHVRRIEDEVSFDLNVSSLDRGVYFYQIIDANGFLIEGGKVSIL